MRFLRNFGGFRVSLGILFLAAFAATASANGLLLTLMAPAAAIAPGSEFAVRLLAVNTGSVAAEFASPEILVGTVWRVDQSWSVTLKALPAEPQLVAAGAFGNRSYSFELPAGVTGRLILEVNQGLASPVTTVISVAVANQGEFAPQPAGGESAPIPQSPTVVSTLQRSFIDHFSALDPIYFIYGPKAPNAKFQFSFKYRLLLFEAGGQKSAESSLQFGYTQRSLWDINASSSPFYDTSYMPSLFYQFLTPAPVREQEKGGVTWLGFASGYQHESNGQDAVASRSLNTLFARTGVLLGRPDRWHAIVQARVFDYVGGLSDNPELKDYRGYADWQVILSRGDGPSLSYSGRAGRDANHFTSQLDLSFPEKTKLLDFATYLLIQYFNGYGESLRAYDKHSDTVRVGLSLVR
jgi:phospholipase A1/A2